MAITNGQTGNASDFVSTSAGAGDSGKSVKLDSTGALDKSFVKGWTQISSASLASGSAAFTGLSAYKRIMVVMQDSAVSASGSRTALVSSDNGVSYYSASGDYQSEGTQLTNIPVSSVATANTGCWAFIIENFNVSGIYKTVSLASKGLMVIRRTEVLNAVSVAATNGNGGTAYIYGQ